LSFIGLGDSGPQASLWGLASLGSVGLRSFLWPLSFSSANILIVSLSFNFIDDLLLDALGPKTRGLGGTAVNNLLSIENLRTTFKTYAGDVQAVRDVSLTVREGECLAVVGESGSGKSVTMLSVMRLLANNARIEGRAIFQGVDLLSLPEREMR